MQILSSAEVGNLCVQWSNSIVARDANQAEVLKADVFSKLKFMEEDDKLIAYVQLLDLKHSLQFNQSDIEEKVEKIPSQVDSMLNFYRFYYLGRHEFYNGRYNQTLLEVNNLEEISFHSLFSSPFIFISDRAEWRQNRHDAVCSFE